MRRFVRMEQVQDLSHLLLMNVGNEVHICDVTEHQGNLIVEKCGEGFKCIPRINPWVNEIYMTDYLVTHNECTYTKDPHYVCHKCKRVWSYPEHFEQLDSCPFCGARIAPCSYAEYNLAWALMISDCKDKYPRKPLDEYTKNMLRIDFSKLFSNSK